LQDLQTRWPQGEFATAICPLQTRPDVVISYSCTMRGDVYLGLQADAKDAARAPLPDIQVESLGFTEDQVRRAGGVITKLLNFAVGRQHFHFRYPAGDLSLSAPEFQHRLKAST
jgi:hypothetical protein